MTSLSERKPQTSPVGDSHSASTGPSAGFLIKIDSADNSLNLQFDPTTPKSRVHLTEAGDICLDWSQNDTEATLAFKPPEGAQIQSLSVGWLVENLDSEAQSLPFQAVSLGGRVILTMTLDPKYATYVCYLVVQKGSVLHRHDPKIYNKVPSGGPGSLG